jgi:ParB family transcriptional regulator, chromosome partitioning protein
MVAKKKALGRGLGALIPHKEAAPPSAREGLVEVAIDRITPNPYQPRKTFHDEGIQELAASVKEHGIVQPLLVTKSGEGRFQLIAGERRFRAAKLAGLETVPVVVKDSVAGLDALEIALIENIQREDLNPIEEAIAYRQLHDEFGLTQEEVARRVGKERSTVANHIRLLKLPDKVKALVAEGQLSMGHARALLAVESPTQIVRLAERVVRDDLNVRQTEALVSPPPPKPKKKEEPKDVFTADAEERLKKSLRTKVEIKRARRGGTIMIGFSSEDELIRLFESLTGGRKQ